MGHAMVVGGAPNMTVPIAGIKASDIAVGSVVKLMENGVATDYLVVNQGIPSGSSQYDVSCDGLWVLRKAIKESRQWNSSNVNDYENSTIHAWLNGDFFNQFGSIEKSIIKQVKIPYFKGDANGSETFGKDGLSTKIFLLSGYEMGWKLGSAMSTAGYFPHVGDCLSYFSGLGEQDSKRIGYLNGNATNWWLRNPYTLNVYSSGLVRTNGGYFSEYCSDSYGIRPALILPKTAVFDKNTMVLVGVK